MCKPGATKMIYSPMELSMEKLTLENRDLVNENRKLKYSKDHLKQCQLESLATFNTAQYPKVN
jgi:hypothetical protein